MKKWLKKFWGFQARPAARRGRIRRGERGMTLLEIMVVLVIIGLATTMIGVAVFGVKTDAEIKTARNQIAMFGDPLKLYRLSFGKYPSTAEGLKALVSPSGNRQPYMEEIPIDPWGNEYVYTYPGSKNTNGYDIVSYGPDGAPGGGDDVGNWAAEGGE